MLTAPCTLTTFAVLLEIADFSHLLTMATADFLVPLLSGVRQRPQDIIDVDALDDETMTILGTASHFQDSRAPEGSRSAFQNAAAGPSSTSIIIVDSSEDEDVSSVNGTANGNVHQSTIPTQALS